MGVDVGEVESLSRVGEVEVVGVGDRGEVGSSGGIVEGEGEGEGEVGLRG